MTDQSRTTINLPVQNSVVDANDRIIFLYSPNTVSAQTASISIKNLLTNTANLQIVAANLVTANLVLYPLANSDPSTSYTLNNISAGTLFFTGNYGYIATGNNFVKRFVISQF